MTEQPAGTSAAASDVVLLADNVVKTYGGVHALRGVTYGVWRGRVNVLVGENGAGKSTLMKVLAGIETPTSGQISLEGNPVHLRSPREASAHGIGIIHQELSLFPNLSVAENLFAGTEIRSRAHLVDFDSQRRHAAAVLDRLGQRIDPDTLVGQLPIGQQQLVEIARVLTTDVRILIMDEPTSALSNQEVDVLFGVIRDLRGQGVTVIYISHKLDELARIGDRITVLRDGQLVADAPIEETDLGWIVENMIGSSADRIAKAEPTRAAGEPLLQVDDLTCVGPSGNLVDGVSFVVRQGEVVGVYGLMGAGRTEMMECLIGTRRAASGTVTVQGKACDKAEVGARIAAGLALVPEDRQRDGLVQTLSVQANVTLASLTGIARRLVLSPGREKTASQEKVRQLNIRIPSLDAPVTALSGGNQQKVVLGRALLTEPTVLLLDEPTRGIDVGAKAEIARIMRQLADAGMAVLFTSSELAEVINMADRILVMARGRVTREFDAASATEKELVAASASAKVMGSKS